MAVWQGVEGPIFDQCGENAMFPVLGGSLCIKEYYFLQKKRASFTMRYKTKVANALLYNKEASANKLNMCEFL